MPTVQQLYVHRCRTMKSINSILTNKSYIYTDQSTSIHYWQTNQRQFLCPHKIMSIGINVLPPRFFKVNKALNRLVRSSVGSTRVCPIAATCSTLAILEDTGRWTVLSRVLWCAGCIKGCLLPVIIVNIRSFIFLKSVLKNAAFPLSVFEIYLGFGQTK